VRSQKAMSCRRTQSLGFVLDGGRFSPTISLATYSEHDATAARILSEPLSLGFVLDGCRFSL